MLRVQSRARVEEPEPPPADPTPADRLDSWKEIATFLGRGVRTVQRWEREEGLPVHRLAHEKRGSVYAIRDELRAWWESRRQALSVRTDDEHNPPAAALQRITHSSAATRWLAVSSDARLIAYVSDGGHDGQTPQLWVQQVGGGAARLTSGMRACRDVAFAPDDTRILFTAQAESGQCVFEVPALGGEPRLLRRGARGGRVSPDGRWLSYISADTSASLRIDSLDQKGVHRVTPALIDVSLALWTEDSAHVVAQAHPDASLEPDFWVIPVDGGPPINTGVMQRLRQRGIFLISAPAAWYENSLIFSVFTRWGIHVWRQRLAAVSFQPHGDPEPLTSGTDLDGYPAPAAGKLAFVSAHPDQNLWSIPIDPATGASRGSPRRLTRGAGAVMFLSVTRDGRTLCYFASRAQVTELRLHDLASGSERVVSGEPQARGYPAISPAGTRLAFSTRMAGPQAARPIYVQNLADDAVRLVREDAGARPRQWLDERRITVETFGTSLNKVQVLDSTNGTAIDLLTSAQSISNPRTSADGRWIAFDTTPPGGSPSVWIARLSDPATPIGETDWRLVDRSASHPFWSADGQLLYYLPTIPSVETRRVMRARRIGEAGPADEPPFDAFTSNELVVPATVSGASPVATANEILCVLGDFHGDVWMMDLRNPG